jgi:RNA polymerase primary sigma factor
MSVRTSAHRDGGSTLAKYLNEISKIPQLTREQEYELAHRIRRPDHPDKEALDVLVKSNLRFVVSIANRYRGCGMATLDLINEGNVGLIEAAKRFDPEKGVKFISYAVWWIRQAIMQALAEQSGAVRLPIKQAGVLYKISNKHQAMTQTLGREPNVVELAGELKMGIEEVEDIMRVSRKSLSIETPLNEDGSSRFVDLMEAKETPPVDEKIIHNSLVGEIEEIIGELKEKEQLVVKLRFGLSGREPLTLEEVGKELNLSRERIRQIEKKAKEQLRRKAKARKLIDFLS